MLYLSGNQLTGEIPAELGNLSDLQLFLMRDNQLSGCIPSILRSLAQDYDDLFQLGLPFCDEMPPTPTPFTSACFNRMSVSTTTIVGRYVDPMNTSALEDSGLVADCVTLLAIRDTLGATSLNWRADLPIDQWQGVTVSNSRVIELNLNRSGLMGEIPAELGNLSHLRELDLAHNQLTGEIPTELGNLSHLQFLHLVHNQLTGTIPAELDSLSNLQVLLLAYNQLTGPIPAELGNLANSLQILFLIGNQLTGPIPPELGNLANSLQILFLGDNQLTGCIPNALSRVSANDLLSLGLSFCDLPPDAYLPRAPTVVARPR